MLDKLDAGRHEARCDRCLAPSPVLDTAVRVDAEHELEALGWTRARNDQWYCAECSVAKTTTGTTTRSRRRRR